MDRGEASALFDKVCDLYRRQVWLPQDRKWGYPLLAAVTLATYHAGHADAWPILDIEGPTASGKGQVISVMRHLAYRTRPIAIVPTVAQLYRYAHVPKGEAPCMVIFDEMRVDSGQADVRAVLNAGVERGKVVARTTADGRTETFRPWGFKVLAHEDPLPRSLQSLRRRCIRIVTFRNEDFVPELPTRRDLKHEVARLRPELGRWKGIKLRHLIRKYLTNKGKVRLFAEERPTWHLVLATASYCRRLESILPALEAYRTGREVSIDDWWREHALPALRSIDPGARRATGLLELLRGRLGANVPPITADQLGRRLKVAIRSGQLPWTSRMLRGGQVYERRRGMTRRAMKQRKLMVTHHR